MSQMMYNKEAVYRDDYTLDKVSIRLVKDSPLLSDFKVTSPADAVKLMGEEMSQLDREMVCVINMLSDGTPKNCHIVSMGGVASSIIDAGNIFKTAILSNAASIIMLHNHPSGSLSPSQEDDMVTSRLLLCSKLMNIRMDDHIIVGGGNTRDYYSYAENGRIEYVDKKIDYMKVMNTDFQNVAENFEYLDNSLSL